MNNQKIEYRLCVICPQKEGKILMYCGNCGKLNPDNAVFCQECGAKLYSSGRPAPVKTMPPPVSGNSIAVETARPIGRLVLVGLAVVALAIIAILGRIFLGGRGYEETAEQFWDAVYSCDTKEILELMPPQMLESVMDEEGYSYERLADEMEKQLEDWVYMLQQANREWNLTCIAIDNDDVTQEELDNIIDTYDEEGITVSNAKNVTVEVTIFLAEERSSSTFEIETPVIKTGKSWYIDIANLSKIIY